MKDSFVGNIQLEGFREIRPHLSSNQGHPRSHSIFLLNET